jgi:hypothetical protein
MNKEKPVLEQPSVVTYEHDELVTDKVITGLANNSGG